jgi:hypothetical protein
MEEKSTKNDPQNDMSKFINDDLFNELNDDSLDLLDDEMNAILSQNLIQNSPKKDPPKRVQASRGAKEIGLELMKPVKPIKKGLKSKAAAKKAEHMEDKVAMDIDMTKNDVENECLLVAEKELREEEIESSQDRQKKFKLTGDYSQYGDPDVADMAKELDVLDDKLDHDLTINFFKTEFMKNVEFNNRNKDYDFSKFKSFEKIDGEMINYLQSGLLKKIINTCEATELNIMFEWILMTVCSHHDMLVLDCSFSLMEHMVSLKLEALASRDFSRLNFEKLARDYFGYDVKTSDDDILCESNNSKRKYEDFRSREITERTDTLHLEIDANSVYSKKQGTARTAGLRSRNKSHVAPDSIAAQPTPKKEYLSLKSKSSPLLSNNSSDMSMEIEGEERGASEESLASLLEIHAFPLHNFYYFIKVMRSCVENHIFKFDDENLLKLLKFCYSSILSVKHLGDDYNYLPAEIRELILAIWKIVQNIEKTTKICKRLVNCYSDYLIGFRYAVYAEMVFQSPHYILKDCGFSIRNYLSIFILKTIVVHKVDFTSSLPEERVDISKGMLSLFNESSLIMKRFLNFITPETNTNHKKCSEFDWQLCVAILLANSIIFPIIPRHGERSDIEDATKEIMVSMKHIMEVIEKWETLLNDSGHKEVETKTKIFMLKIDYVNHLKELDEFIANPTKDQIKKETKQKTLDGFFSPKK